MSLPRYPEYKDSGAPWIGEVPAHWPVLKIKTFTEFSGGGTPSRDKLAYWNGDIPWVSPKDMKSERITGAEECITSEGLLNSSSSMVDAGRLLMVVRSGILKHTIPVAINDVPVALNQDMKALRFSEQLATSGFFLRWVQGLNDALLLAWAKQGATVESIEHGYLAETPVPLPPLEEQQAIATFLDRETAKIDALIAEQEKLLALLAEKRQATISHAVTRGLNPNAPMKDSGIPWLGEVPAHWEHRRLTELCHFQSGKAHEPYVDDDGKYVCVNSRFVSTEGASRKYCTENFSPAAQQDILMVMSDLPHGRALAKAYFVNDDGAYAVNQRVCILTTFAAFPRFMYYLLDRNPHFLSYDDGVNQTHLPNFAFEKFKAYFPPESEQRCIAAFLDDFTKWSDDLDSRASRAVKLLRERRTALISAAVTGKIDVREIA